MGLRPMDRRSLLQIAATAGLTAAGTATGLTAAQTYWRGKPRSRFSDGCYVQMGTSVTAGVIDTATITPDVVGKRLDMPAINAAFDGACAGHNKYPAMEHRSLYCLVDSLVAGDWSPQNSESVPRLKEHVFRLKICDFSKVTHLGLEYGTNDFRYERPIGLSGDVTTETFEGALNNSLRKLMSSFPHLRVFLMTPSWQIEDGSLDRDVAPNSDGLFLKGYVDAMLRVAEMNHIPCLDMWRNLGLNASNYKAFTLDGVHPNEPGAVMRGNLIASFMSAVF